MFFLKIELYIYLIMAFINIYKLIGARSFPSFCRGDPLLLRSMPGGGGWGCYNNTEKPRGVGGVEALAMLG